MRILLGDYFYVKTICIGELFRYNEGVGTRYGWFRRHTASQTVLLAEFSKALSPLFRRRDCSLDIFRC